MWVDIVVSIAAVLAGIIGIVGCIVPGLPGPPISWLGLLILFIWGNGAVFNNQVGVTGLIIWGVLTIIVTVLDFIVPSYMTKITGGSKAAERGALIGLFAGMILGWIPINGILLMILCSYLGALIGELAVAKKKFWPACKSSLGSFAGFLLGTGVKLIVAFLILVAIIMHL